MTNNLIRAVPWLDSFLHELTLLGRRALELADAAPPADPPPPPANTPPPIKLDGEQVLTVDERALARFFADRSRTKKEIARLLGVQTQSICPSRCPQLHQAMQAWRAANAGRRLRNVTIDLRLGEIREHRREDMITKVAPVAFDPDADCPKWRSFGVRCTAVLGRKSGKLGRRRGPQPA